MGLLRCAWLPTLTGGVSEADEPMNEVIVELKMLLENLCSVELNASGREYVRRRIKHYENKINEARISKDATGNSDGDADR